MANAGEDDYGLGDIDFETEIGSDISDRSSYFPDFSQPDDYMRGRLACFVPEEFDRFFNCAVRFAAPQYQYGKERERFKGTLKYFLMSAASRRLRLNGEYRQSRLLRSEPPPFQLPRSLDTRNFSDSSSSRYSVSLSLGHRMSPPPGSYHHKNFNLEPIAQKSFTPASVSMWFALYTARNPTFSEPVSCQAVVLGQAVKWIDPFTYIGPALNFNHLAGTSLESVLRVSAHIVYLPQGAWQHEQWPSNRPLSTEHTQYFDSISQNKKLPTAFIMNHKDIRIRDPVINDGHYDTDNEGLAPPKNSKTRRRPKLASKLRYELGRDEEIEGILANLRAANLAVEANQVAAADVAEQSSGQEVQPGPMGIPGEEYRAMVRSAEEAQEEAREAAQEAEGDT